MDNKLYASDFIFIIRMHNALLSAKKLNCALSSPSKISKVEKITMRNNSSARQVEERVIEWLRGRGVKRGDPTDIYE